MPGVLSCAPTPLEKSSSCVGILSHALVWTSCVYFFFFLSPCVGVQNFRIYPGLQPKRTGKTVAFTGHITSPEKDTQSVQYRLRVATEAAATELVEAMEHEVRLVQTNSSPST
jgi:hypothetical protein